MHFVQTGHVVLTGWSLDDSHRTAPVVMAVPAGLRRPRVGVRHLNRSARRCWSLMRLLRGPPGARAIVGGRRRTAGGGGPGVRMEHIYLHDRRASLRRRDGLPRSRRGRSRSARLAAMGASRGGGGRRPVRVLHPRVRPRCPGRSSAVRRGQRQSTAPVWLSRRWSRRSGRMRRLLLVVVPPPRLF